jgi:hypothetical protein
MKRMANKQIIGIGLVAVLVALAGYLAVNRRNTSNVPGADNNTVSSENIQFPGPTEQELSDTDKHKENLANNDQQTGNSNEKITVTPVITSANVNEVRGYVSGIAEDGGKCTATYTRGATTFTRTSTGILNVSNTICQPIKTSRSDFAVSGIWSVTLAYSSSSAEGISQTGTVEVN